MGEIIGSENWSKEEFEDSVARGLMCCYESKIVRLDRGDPSTKIKAKNLAVLRAVGPFFAAHDRVWDGSENEQGFWSFDVGSDRLPKRAVYSQTGGLRGNTNYTKNKDAYITIFLCEQIEDLPKHYHRMDGGQLYRTTIFLGLPEGICGSMDYFSVNSEGICVPCDIILQEGGFRTGGIGKKGAVIRISEHDPDGRVQCSVNGSLTLQTGSDKRFQWSIRASEARAKATLGCGKEEVKSLLYARSLPMTETGRKRPILHLVEAHKRRLKNGTEIDITSFLRGTQIVEIAGTEFKVKPPLALAPDLSENSQKYFPDDDQD